MGQSCGRVGVLLGFAACSSPPAAPPAPPVTSPAAALADAAPAQVSLACEAETPERRAYAFAYLTATDWTLLVPPPGGRKGPSTTFRLTLRRDGTHEETARSDVVELVHAGGWGFRLCNAEVGLVWFEGGLARPFVHRGGSLELAGASYLPDARAPAAASAPAPAVGPSALAAPPLLAALAAHAWTRTHGFASPWPEVWSFTELGRYRAGFRDGDGACVEEGFFELRDRGWSSIPDGKTCGFPAWEDLPRLEDGLLVLPDVAYAPERRERDTIVKLDPALLVRAELDGELAIGRTTALEVTLRNLADTPVALDRIEVRLGPEKGAGFATRKDYRGRKLAVHAEERYRVTFAPEKPDDLEVLSLAVAARAGDRSVYLREAVAPRRVRSSGE